MESTWGNRHCRGGRVYGQDDPYEAFMWMFPTYMLNLIVRETDILLDEYCYSTATPGETLKFFDVLVLRTRFKFGNCAALWRNTEMN